jgi:hypothetical protein
MNSRHRTTITFTTISVPRPLAQAFMLNSSIVNTQHASSVLPSPVAPTATAATTITKHRVHIMMPRHRQGQIDN